jgi:hypothetical protein
MGKILIGIKRMNETCVIVANEGIVGLWTFHKQIKFVGELADSDVIYDYIFD